MIKKHIIWCTPWLIEHRCFALLISLVVLLFIVFLADAGTYSGRLVITVATTTVFLGGIASVGNSSKHFVAGVLLMRPPLVMEWLATTLGWDNSNILLVPNLYSLPFYIFIIYVVSSYVFHSGKVTQDRMFGAICIYLMMGLLWANAYRVIYQLNPAAFKFGLEGTDSFLGPFRELLYFSYVTLTTMGYGDTLPISAHARILALFEAISGVLFVGILIARLAGKLNTAKSSKS